MYTWQNNVFYYLTLENENYFHPKLPNYEIKEEIIKGMYCYKKCNNKKNKLINLLGSGSMLNETIKAAELLKKDWNIEADIWSVTSYSELHKNAEDIDRWNNLHPETQNKLSYLDKCFKNQNHPVIAISDYVKLVAEQISPYINCPFVALGTDGFGRSDTREALRDFFEVNKFYIVISSINLLSKSEIINKEILKKAIKKYNIDANKPNPKSI